MDYINDIPGAPKAIGPYSAAVVAGNMVFISGQIPLDPTTGNLVADGINEQAEQVMSNLQAVLRHLDLDFSRVAMSTIYLTNLGDFQTVNAIYEKWLQGNKPARATVQVAALPKGCKIEISVIAVRG